jgi:hypothetical protein
LICRSSACTCFSYTAQRTKVSSHILTSCACRSTRYAYEATHKYGVEPVRTAGRWRLRRCGWHGKERWGSLKTARHSTQQPELLYTILPSRKDTAVHKSNKTRTRTHRRSAGTSCVCSPRSAQFKYDTRPIKR